jgi:hypothetical protein
MVWIILQTSYNVDSGSKSDCCFVHFEAEGEREEKVEGVAIGTTFNGREHKFTFAATKVPRQCPLVLLVKVGSVFGSGKGRMKSGARREVEQGLTAFMYNFEFWY